MKLSKNPSDPSSTPQPGDKPISKSPTSISGEHKLNLTLSSSENKKTVERITMEVDAQRKDVKISESPEHLDPEAAKQELEEASLRLVDSVDKITDVLLLILGKFDGTIKRVNIGTFIALLAFSSMIYTIYKVEKLVGEINNMKIQYTVLFEKIKESSEKIDKVQDTAKKTEEKVELGNQNQDGDIHIVQDLSGAKPSAKIVITSKKDRSKPVASAGSPPSPEPSASSSTFTIEVPIDFSKVKPSKQDSGNF